MTDNPNLYCEACGAKLASGANFCESCGTPVKRLQGLAPAPPEQAVPEPPLPEEISPEPLPPMPPEPARAYTPPPAYNPPPAYTSAPIAPKKSNKLPYILGGIGCLGLLCIGMIVAGVILFSRNATKIEELTQGVPVQITQPAVQPQAPPTRVAAPTQPAAPTQVPAPTEPAPSTQAMQPTAVPLPTQAVVEPVVWPPDIEQQLTSSYFSDNFSSNQYDWAEVADDIRIWGFEEGHYALHMFEPDYSIWAYLPVEFNPTTIGYDAAVQPGYEQGGYGVLCFYEDEDNFHFVSLDPYNKEYSIGYVENGEYIALMDEMWMPSTALKDSLYAVNTLMVSCDADMITLFVNDTFEAQAKLPALETPGVSAIFGEAWEDMPEPGFKVFIDNFYAFKPMQ